jgi:hypothetical protein
VLGGIGRFIMRSIGMPPPWRKYRVAKQRAGDGHRTRTKGPAARVHAQPSPLRPRDRDRRSVVDRSGRLEENLAWFWFALGGDMSWKLEGSYFVTCSCNVVRHCAASPALGASHQGNANFSRSRFSWAAR